MTRINIGLSLSYVKFLLSELLIENIIICAFDVVVYQQIVYSKFLYFLFFFYYETDFMSHLHKFKWYGNIDMFNDASRYVDKLLYIRHQ